MLLLGAVTITSRPVQTYAYTDEQKQQAKDWLSAHGYAPTRAGAEQAYQDYLDGKIDVPEADAYLGKNQKQQVEEKKSSTANTKNKNTQSGSDNSGKAETTNTEAGKAENSEETTQNNTTTTTEAKTTTETKQQQKQKEEKKKQEQKKEKKKHATGITIGIVAVAIFAILVVIMRKRM